MSDKEREIGTQIAEAVEQLPSEKQQFFRGYARGLADMAKVSKGTQDDEEKRAG